MENIEQNIEKSLVIEESLSVVKKSVGDLGELEGLKVSGKPTLEKSAEGLKIISKVSKIIKEEKDKNIKPLRQVIANINGFWAPFESKIEEIEVHLKKEQADYLKVLKQKEIDEKDKLKSELESGSIEGGKTLEKFGAKLNKIEEIKSAIKTFTYTGVKILDKSKIPLEFMIVDEAAVLRALKSGVAVSGAEIFTEERIKKG